jgi:hypothetical protein
VILSIRNAIFGYQWSNYCLNQSWRSINDEFSSEYFKVVQCCYIETDKELAYSFVEFTYNGDLLLQSIYDDDNDRSTIPARCSHEANFYQTNLGKVVVKCQGGYCGYSNTPLIIVIKS